MSQEPTYTIIQRDTFGKAVNTITGLDERVGGTLAAVLRTGDACTGERPWTVDLVRELTEAEKLAQRIEAWLTDRATLGSTVDMATAFELLADRLRSLGDQPLGQVWLTVDVQVSQSGDEQARRGAVDLLASVVGVAPEEKAHGSYSSYSVNDKSPFRVFTPIEMPKPQADTDTKPFDVAASVDPYAVPANRISEAPAVEHRHATAWKGEAGECGASCACGTTFDGFDTLGEAVELLERHIADPDGENTETVGTPAEPASAAIPAERVDELLRELNHRTVVDSDWWGWITEQPEYDPEATQATGATGELHLTDGTVLRWATDTAWTVKAEAS